MKLSYEPINGGSWLWIKKHVDCLAIEDMCGIVAVNEHGEYMAAAVFDTWTGNSVSVSFAIANPLVLRSDFLELISSYVFEERGANIAYAQVPENNVKALKFNEHFGFKEVARLKDTFKDGVGCVILELTKENCKHLLKEVA